MKLIWRFFIFALSFVIYSCNVKEEKVIDPTTPKEKKEVVLDNDDSDLHSKKEPIENEVVIQTKKESSIEQSFDEPIRKIEESKVVKASTPEKIVSIHDKIDVQNINHPTLIGLVEEGINQIRKEKGLSILGNRRNLKDAATIQNDYCIRESVLSHSQEDIRYGRIRDRIANFGGRYSTIGENIQYYGFLNNEINGEVFLFPPDYQEAAKDIVKAWVDSPGHYENIVNNDFKSFGTAVGWNDQLHAIFVTQVYGG